VGKGVALGPRVWVGTTTDVAVGASVSVGSAGTEVAAGGKVGNVMTSGVRVAITAGTDVGGSVSSSRADTGGTGAVDVAGGAGVTAGAATVGVRADAARAGAASGGGVG
jgi:hypothetical protein